MAEINQFEPLRGFGDRVLDEVVREGELRIAAQLQAAIAADQRALTFAGFQIASATAALGGGTALIVGGKRDFVLAALAIAFAAMLLSAAVIALRTVRPKRFGMPGSSPSDWLPDHWRGSEGGRFDLKQARIEQAANLDGDIQENSRITKQAAAEMHRSMDITLRAIGLAAVALVAIIVVRHFTILEPNSIIRIMGCA